MLRKQIEKYFSIEEEADPIKINYYTAFTKNKFADFVLAQKIDAGKDKMAQSELFLDVVKKAVKRMSNNETGFFILSEIISYIRSAKVRLLTYNDFLNEDYTRFPQLPMRVEICGLVVKDDLLYYVTCLYSYKEQNVTNFVSHPTKNLLNPIIFFHSDDLALKQSSKRFIAANNDYFYAYLFLRNLLRAHFKVPRTIFNRFVQKINDLFDIGIKEEITEDIKEIKHKEQLLEDLVRTKIAEYFETNKMSMIKV